VTPQDLVYKQAFDQVIQSGLSQRDAEGAGAEAVRRWRRNTPAIEAVAESVRQAKRISAK
jgi:hypothetical protein